jgi:RND family efflux transporter MFP subunit
LAVAAVVVVAGLIFRSCSRGGAADASVAVAVEDAITIWVAYEGTLDSRLVRNINSDLAGGATLTELAPDGGRVKEGDVLVRFDSSNFERELVKAEREYSNAQEELTQLASAKHPLEINDLEMSLLEARTSLDAEETYLADTRDLVGEGLVAEAEVAQQETKVIALRTQVTNLVQKLDVTRTQLHPSQVGQARATLLAAERELSFAQRQLSNCVVFAPSDGIVVYKPVFVGGEQRTVEVGDTIFRSQIFMALPDMTNLVVHLSIPEAELSTIREGQSALIAPAAYPDLELRGRIEFVGTMAQSEDNSRKGPRFFRVVVALEESRPELRTGMSVACRVLTFESEKALLIPRRCVFWENDVPYCKIKKHGVEEKRTLKLGRSDDQRFVVLEGLAAGEKVLAP